jgi:HD-GYP domain-containing protein (c-di-GMP phosphodiesterase class II)
VAALQQQLTQQGAVTAQQQVELHQLEQNGQFWKERVEQLQQENQRWKQAYKQEQQTVQELRQTVANRDEEAVVLADRIVDLQTAITRLARWHQTTVRNQLQTVNRTFRAAIQELSGFTATLTDHEEDLQTLLVEMGADVDEEEEQQQQERVQDAAAVVVTPERRQVAVDRRHHAREEDDKEEEEEADEMISAQQGDDFEDYEDVADDEALVRATQAASVAIR